MTIKFKTSKEFYDWCVEQHACAEGLAEIRDKTAADFWDETKRVDWLLWLSGKGAWNFTSKQRADYNAKIAKLNADYEVKIATLHADYKAKVPTLLRSVVGNPFNQKIKREARKP